MSQRGSPIDRLLSRVKKNPIIAALIALGTIIITVAAVTNATKDLLGLIKRQSPEEARAQLSRLSLDYSPAIFVDKAREGDLVALKLFLAAGMSPNAKHLKLGQTALMAAATEGHAPIVDALLAAKADVGQKDDNGTTALMWAAVKGDARVLEALLKAKANVNEKDRHGRTALARAASAGRADAVRLLLAKGADADAVNRAFVDAAAAGHLELLRVLRDKGADVRAAGSAALIAAVKRDNINKDVGDTVRFLLDLGVDVNGKDENGWSALHLAADRGNAALMRRLLDKGSDVNAVCSCQGYHAARDWTALQMAAFNGQGEVADMLLASGADVHRRNSTGNTPLHSACYGGSLRIVQALLAKGVEVNAKDEDGETPLMGPSGDNADTAHALLDRGADVNARDNRGWTALMHDARWGREVRARALLGRGADVNARGASGETALMIAAAGGRTPIVRVLLAAGASADAKDSQGRTARDNAEGIPDEKRRTEITQLLQQAPARSR